jgi:mono/diheme cytochrome c family protein
VVPRAARHLIAVLVTGLAVATAACGQDASQSAAERGERAYRANCAACHGNDLAGTSLGPSLLGPAPSGLSDAEIRDVIRNGVEDSGGEFGAMPGNTVLRDAQVNEIIEHLRGVQEQAAGS